MDARFLTRDARLITGVTDTRALRLRIDTSSADAGEFGPQFLGQIARAADRSPAERQCPLIRFADRTDIP